MAFLAVRTRNRIVRCKSCNNHWNSHSPQLTTISVNSCTGWLPQEKPRYVMGIGYPEDLLVSVALGADMFDCVWPTRTAVSNLFPRHSLEIC